MKLTKKGVCCEGFLAAGVRRGKYGVAIILSEKQANCSVMVTSNRVIAAPLIVTREHAKNRELRGIVANSGCANAYTGKDGIEDARKMCELAALELQVNPDDLAVASTGVIGRRLPMSLIESLTKKAAKNLKCSSAASLATAKAIMTTDRFPKMISVKTTLKSGEEVEIGGIAKGAGMIAPQLKHATMLCFITTNAFVPKEKIDCVLEQAVEQSFNAAIVDGDTSTNDIVILLANGLAKNKDVDENFQSALNYVTRELAKMLVRDGEGATKLIEVNVVNAATKDDAVKVARAIARSNLVKTALFGGDPNWGRIIAAAGYSGAEFNPEEISLYLAAGKESVALVERGKVLAFHDVLKKAEKIMKKKEIKVLLDLHMGSESATAFGCDLTYNYIKINAEYTT